MTTTAADPALRDAFIAIVRALSAAHGLDPEDLEQQVWLRAAAEPRRAHPGARLRALTIQEFRSARATTRVPPAPLPAPTEARSPEALVLDAERSRELRATAARLPARCPALVAALLEAPALSYGELARELSVPRGSLGPTRSRCLACLRRLLGADAAEWVSN